MCIRDRDNRIANGKKFSILAVAEGALSKEEAAMKKKDFKKARAEMKYPSIVYRLADELASRVDKMCIRDRSTTYPPASLQGRHVQAPETPRGVHCGA